MKRHHARRRPLIGLALHRKRFILHTVGNIRVPGEAQEHLIQHVLEYEILIIVRSRQLYVLEDKLIDNMIGGPNAVAQLLPVLDVLLREFE